jgi:LacI family transcriptional regulator
VAVALKTWTTFSNQAIAGVFGYARKHPRFTFRDILWSKAEELPDQLARVRPEGAILSLSAVEFARIHKALPSKLPMVSIGIDTLDNRVGVVCSDDRAMASLAAEHLRSAGFRRIAFVGWEASPGATRRAAALRRLCRGVEVFDVRLPGPFADLDAAAVKSLKAWLRSLRLPVGVVALTGTIAGHVRQACHQTGLAVPNDVGILSQSDERTCLFGDPAISAMELDGERLGYGAMTMLAAMMRGNRAPTKPLMVPPIGVIARESTAVETKANDSIDGALRFIDENATRGIAIKNVLAKLPDLRRTRFYAEFTARVGCSPADYIRRLKIDRAKALLVETELTATRIAAMCGFASLAQFGDTFKREVGSTPQEFRRQRPASDSCNSTS